MIGFTQVSKLEVELLFSLKLQPSLQFLWGCGKSISAFRNDLVLLVTGISHSVMNSTHLILNQLSLCYINIYCISFMIPVKKLSHSDLILVIYLLTEEAKL